MILDCRENEKEYVHHHGESQVDGDCPETEVHGRQVKGVERRKNLR